MKTLAVVPARGGSRGIPRKNLRMLDGKPLIAHAIESGLRAKRVSRLIVSTDDDEIARVSRFYGAEVPFQRPASLATDTASQIDVVLHALSEVETLEGTNYDCVVLLQPTAPLRTSDDIDTCLETLEMGAADSVMSFYRVEHAHPHYMYTMEEGHPVPLLKDSVAVRRQDFPTVYVRNGAIYAIRRNVFVKNRRFHGQDTLPYVMPYERSVNIDTELDLALAEFFLSQVKGKP